MAFSLPSYNMYFIPGQSDQVPDVLDVESAQAGNQQFRGLLGPVAILWDIENCPVPGEVCPEDVAGNIRMALGLHPMVKGAVTMLSAYGDFNNFPRRLREGCQKTGVNLIDVPNGRKDAADKAKLCLLFQLEWVSHLHYAMLVDLFGIGQVWLEGKALFQQNPYCLEHQILLVITLVVFQVVIMIPKMKKLLCIEESPIMDTTLKIIQTKFILS